MISKNFVTFKADNPEWEYAVSRHKIAGFRRVPGLVATDLLLISGETIFLNGLSYEKVAETLAKFDKPKEAENAR